MSDRNEAFSKWYEGHKDQLSQQRRDRYANDPEYRQKALDRRAKQLEKNRTSAPLPDAYTMTFSEAADDLGITVWKMRHWREQGYFPEPYQHGKALYFTDHQVELLAAIKEYLDPFPRLPESAREELNNIVGVVHHNWNK